MTTTAVAAGTRRGERDGGPVRRGRHAAGPDQATRSAHTHRPMPPRPPVGSAVGGAPGTGAAAPAARTGRGWRTRLATAVALAGLGLGTLGTVSALRPDVASGQDRVTVPATSTQP